MGILQRNQKADYLDVSGSHSELYAFMGTGFTEVGDSPSAQTGSKKYINMKSATKSVKSYDWSAPFTCDLVDDEVAIEFIRSIGEGEKTGDEAETFYVKVDLKKRVGVSGQVFKAKKRKVAVAVSEFSDDEGEMQCSGDLLGVTDWTDGTFDLENQKFTEETAGTIGTLTVQSAAGSAAGKTKVTATPAKASANNYVYKTGKPVTLPEYHDVCFGGYTTWNGTDEIDAVTGNEIVIVEIDADNRAVKAGKATVTAKA